jgi:opacity protein-like surface antigen
MHRGSLAALLLAGVAFAPVASAQEGGTLLSATISERLEANSNYGLDDPSPGTSYFADTRLSLGYLNETPTQSFGLGFSTGARALWEAEEDFDLTLASPTGANLNYGNEWAAGAFDADFRYRQREVNVTRAFDDFIGDDEEPLPDDLTQLQDDTREHRYDANIGVEFATDSPSSYELGFQGTNIDYDEVSANRVPRYTLVGEGAWRLRLSPVIASQVYADHLFYSADDDEQTEIRRSEIGAGAVYQPSENLEVSGGLGFAQRERTELVGGDRETTEDDSGPSLRGEFAYTTASLTLGGEAVLSAAAPETRLNAIFRASYALPRGRVNGRVYQRYTGTSTGGQEARITGFNIGIVREITSVSSVGLDFAYATQVDVEDDDDEVTDPDIDRANITATYSHALTEAVFADIGYRFRSRDEEPDSAQSHAVFLEVGRTFETRP